MRAVGVAGAAAALALVLALGASSAASGAVECDVCVAAMQEVEAGAINATGVNATIAALERECALVFPQGKPGRAACDAVAKALVDLSAYAVRELSSLAWDAPQLCAVGGLCKVDCCLSDGPEQLHIALGRSAGAIAVSWATRKATPTSTVRWGASPDALNRTASGSATTYTEFGWVGRLHTAVLTGLPSGATVFYEAGDSQGGWSQVRSFRTLAANAGTDASPLRVASIGDMGYGNTSDATVARLTELVDAGAIDLVIHNGDISYADGDQHHWDVFMRKIEPVASRVPYMVAPGNHEFWFNFTAYKRRFAMPVEADAPEDTMHYGFDVGNSTRFVAMNTECELDIAHMSRGQVAWIEAILSQGSPAPWTVAFGHRPLYCSNHGGNDIPQGNAVLRNAVEGTLNRGRVDLVLQAHVHDYERTWPVFNGVATSTNYTDPTSPVYVVNGGAGNREGNDHAPGGQPWQPPLGSNCTASAISFGVFTMTTSELRWRQIVSADGSQIDAFTITKTRPSQARTTLGNGDGAVRDKGESAGAGATPQDTPADPTVLTSTELQELMPYVGNGFVATHPIPGSSGGVRGAYTGNTVYLAGGFNGAQFAANRSHRAAIPGWVTNLTMREPGVAPGGSSTGATAVTYSLNLQRAVLRKHSTWALDGGGTFEVDEAHYAHRTLRNLLVHAVTLTNTGTHAVTVDVAQAPGPDCGGPYGCDVELRGLPAPPGVRLVNGSNLQSETASTPLTTVAVASTTLPPTATVEAGKTATLLVVSAFASSLDAAGTGSTPAGVALAAHGDAVKAGAASLLESHVAGWDELWARGRVEVEGDSRLAGAINASLYYILSSIREDWEYGLSPGGLASGGYHGHTFWDQETWMWPPLLLLQPGIARSALAYRANRVDGAVALARTFGRAGLRFPWESALTGVETETGGGKLAGCSVHEIHISGDICFAFWQYWSAQRDRQWLASEGAGVMRGVATFYASRVSALADGGYGILGVMGPDEYHGDVNNSAYVNTVAALSLLSAINVSRELGLPVPSNWSTIASGMRLPVAGGACGPSNGALPEYDAYESGTKVKQADTIMLAYPLATWSASFGSLPNLDVNRTEQATNLDYYANHTDAGGPAMTWALFSIGYLDSGDATKALANFQRGYANAQPPFNVWTETPRGGCVNFITGAGGFLQSVLSGYGGVRLVGQALSVSPPAPPGNATALTLRGVSYRGWRLEVRSTRSGFALSALSKVDGAPQLVASSDGGSAVPLVVGGLPLTAERPSTLVVAASLGERVANDGALL